MRNTNCLLLSANDDVTRTSGKIDSNQIVSASFHAYFSDSDVSGNVKIQASNDLCSFGNVAADFTPTNWVDVPDSLYPVVDGGAVLITIPHMCYRWIRAVFTKTTAGSGTVTINMNALSV